MFSEDEQQDTDLELMVPEQEESIIKVIGVGAEAAMPSTTCAARAYMAWNS